MVKRQSWSLPRRQFGDGAVDVVDGERRWEVWLWDGLVWVQRIEVGFGWEKLVV
jgi:hypothetical protein